MKVEREKELAKKKKREAKQAKKDQELAKMSKKLASAAIAKDSGNKKKQKIKSSDADRAKADGEYYAKKADKAVETSKTVHNHQAKEGVTHYIKQARPDKKKSQIRSRLDTHIKKQMNDDDKTSLSEAEDVINQAATAVAEEEETDRKNLEEFESDGDQEDIETDELDIKLLAEKAKLVKDDLKKEIDHKLDRDLAKA